MRKFNWTAHTIHQGRKITVLSCHRCLINTGVKNEPHFNKENNFAHKMSLSKSKCWYSNNCLHFLMCSVPLVVSLVKHTSKILKFWGLKICSNFFLQLQWLLIYHQFCNFLQNKSQKHIRDSFCHQVAETGSCQILIYALYLWSRLTRSRGKYSYL